jgi:hypothetical protein
MDDGMRTKRHFAAAAPRSANVPGILENTLVLRHILQNRWAHLFWAQVLRQLHCGFGLALAAGCFINTP